MQEYGKTHFVNIAVAEFERPRYEMPHSNTSLWSGFTKIDRFFIIKNKVLRCCSLHFRACIAIVLDNDPVRAMSCKESFQVFDTNTK